MTEQIFVGLDLEFAEEMFALDRDLECVSRKEFPWVLPFILFFLAVTLCPTCASPHLSSSLRFFFYSLFFLVLR